MRQSTLLGWTLLGAMALLASAPSSRPPRFVYNASDSAPRGWYRVAPPEHLRVGDYVIVQLPRQVAAFADRRGYLPLTVPALKRVAAAGGQHVCEKDGAVAIAGVPTARALGADSHGRPLTAWRQCRRLIDDELFLLNAAPDSFDSRYFGPVDASYVRGVAVPLAAPAHS